MITGRRKHIFRGEFTNSRQTTELKICDKMVKTDESGIFMSYMNYMSYRLGWT